VLARRHVPAEERAEGVLIGYSEETERADHHMHVHGVYVGDEVAARPSGVEDPGNEVEHRRAERHQRFGFAQVLRVVDVLDADELDEVLVLLVIIERQLGQRAYRLHRRQMLDVNGRFRRPDLAVRLLQDRHVQLLFAPEVVIDHPFCRAHERGHVVNSGPGVPVPRELPLCDVEDLRPGAFGVTPAPYSGRRCGEM
jgi:hypothetical protein